MHEQPIEDHDGNIVNTIPFCSDACRRDWCHTHGVEYTGWNGALGEGQDDEWCAKCGVRCRIGLSNDRCDTRCLPVVVCLIGPITDTCRHGIHQCLIRHEIMA